MLGNFSYSDPAELWFGGGFHRYLNEELSEYKKTVQLVYGGGATKSNGNYNQVMELLRAG